MSLSRQQIRAQRAAAAEARRQAEKAGEGTEATEAGKGASPASPVIPSPTGEINPTQSTSAPEPYRPQAFTPDLIPDPVEIEAEGELTPQEIEDLGHCEAAFTNGGRAEWMKWKAAHAVRALRLHRQGGRTWPDYCQDRFGESESEVNRRIQQWPLLQAITEQQDQPRAIPDSHVQQLLPMVKQHGQDVTARVYVELRAWAAERRHRVTAAAVKGLVDLARAAEAPTLTTSNAFQLAIEAKPKKAATRPGGKTSVRAATAEIPERSMSATGDHSNSRGHRGEDPAGETTASGDEAVLDAEIVDDQSPHRAAKARDLLQGVLLGLESGALRAAPAETLKEISAAAHSIASWADDLLKGE